MRLYTCGLLFLALVVAACRPDGPTGVGADPSVSSVTLSPESAEVAVYGRLKLEATLRDDRGEILPEGPLTWSSSDSSVAAIDGAGEVTGRALGSVTVTANANGVAGQATVDVRGFLIGTAGGVAASEDGRAWAAIPAGALPAEVTVTLAPAGTAGLPEGGESQGFVPGSAYRLEVGSQPFSPPAQLTVRYDRSAVPPDVAEASLRLSRESGGSWTQIPGSAVDPSSTEVRGPADRSGVYAAVGVPRDDPPEATITAPPDGSSFRWGEAVSFTGTATDREDGELHGGALVWRSDRDGQLGTGRSVTTGANGELSIGEHAITLTATDSKGQTGIDQIGVTIENNPPIASIASPSDGSVFLRGRSITFQGSGTDPEDGTLTGGALVWTSSRDGEFGTGQTVTTSELSTGNHTITLTVRDSRGATDTDQITISVIGVF